MAQLNTDSGGRKDKKGKPKRMNLRVDFTPMVDMNMLLITFFMFCTTLSIPQVMDIAMPSKLTEDVDRPELSPSNTITLILGGEDKIYYYAGLPNYDDYKSLKEITYGDLRDLLLARNMESVEQIRELRKKKRKKEISETEFKSQVSEIKKSKYGLNVLIKPTNASCYKNMVDALDEMQICGIGRYAILDIEEGDQYLVDNFKAKGSLTAYLNTSK